MVQVFRLTVLVSMEISTSTLAPTQSMGQRPPVHGRERGQYLLSALLALPEQRVQPDQLVQQDRLDRKALRAQLSMDLASLHKMQQE